MIPETEKHPRKIHKIHFGTLSQSLTQNPKAHMLELNEQNVIPYLRQHNRISQAGSEILVQSLSGGVANVVLKILDLDGGAKVGSDTRSPEQIKNNLPDTRPNESVCFVLKQPLPQFKTAAEWLVDIDRVHVERDCIELLNTLLPEGSVPRVLWFDAENYILAISAAPAGALPWKKLLLENKPSTDAAIHAGMLLAMMHSATHDDAAVQARYGDPKFFIQQRIDPYLRATADLHPDVAPQIRHVASRLLNAPFCLIHGDFSPKNILIIPDSETPPSAAVSPTAGLFLLDFEVAFYGHPAFDVATLINHFLLKGFYHGKNWRNFMVMADAFWNTYRHTADKTLVAAANRDASPILASLLLARVDGKSPAEYLADDEAKKSRIRAAAKHILQSPAPELDPTLDALSLHFET